MSHCVHCGTERQGRGLYCRENGKNCKRDRDRQAKLTQKECRLCGRTSSPLAKAYRRLYVLAVKGRDISAQVEIITKIREEQKQERIRRKQAATPETTMAPVGTAPHLPESQQTTPQGAVQDVQHA